MNSAYNYKLPVPELKMSFGYFTFAGIIAISNAFIPSLTGRTEAAIANLSTNDKARIYGVGSEVQSGELKYRLSLRPFLNSSNSNSCGASLVEVEGIQVAITSALCPHLHTQAAFAAYYASNDTRKPSEYLKVIGGNFKRGGNEVNQQERQIVDFVIHEKFDIYKSPLNDIAVVFFDKPFDKNDHVDTLLLPKQSQAVEGRVILSGWGPPKTKIVDNEVVLDPFETLNKVEVPVLSYDACNRSLNSNLTGESTDNFLCTGFKNKWSLVYKNDDCHSFSSDSGGPIKSIEGNNLAGIISSGNACKGPDSLSVNTNVSRYIDWITEEVKKHKASGSDEDSKEENELRLRGLLKKLKIT